MKAVVSQEGKKTAVENKEIPSIAKDEILVKVIGVSLNPTDWKHVEYLSPPGVIVGCDYAGVVEKVGEDVKNLKIGDRVGGIVHGAKYTTNGSFAEYVAGVADVAYVKPDHLSFEETATFGVGSLTAGACLYQRLGLPTPSKPATETTYLLVWSGATSVGQFAVQLGKLSGLTVITTCSPKNNDLLSSLGADHIFDYRDPDVVKKIKEVTQNKLAHALDCVSETQSLKQTIESIGEKGGKVAALLSTKVESVRADVEIIRELLYTALGKELVFAGQTIPAAPQDRQFIADYIKNELNPLLIGKKIKPNVTKALEGGLAGIPEGLLYLKSGKASAEKLVAHVQNE